MNPPRVAVVSGGLGGARVALALRAAELDAQTCFVTNVGDDLTVDGLLVCPDTDAVLYALAGMFDEERGWGIRGDVFRGVEAGSPRDADSGAREWFNLGERDYAHHARRRALLDGGLGLAAATARLAADLGIVSRVIPATDDEVRTHVVTADGSLAWQEWLVRERAAPVPIGVEFRGAESARADHDALVALRGAELVVLAPSSPIASIAPILAIPGYAEVLRDRLRGGLTAGRGSPYRASRTVAVSPVVVRRKLVTDRDRHRSIARASLLRARGFEHTPAAVAGLYRDLVDAFILDPADVSDLDEVRSAAGPGASAMLAPGPTTEVEGLTALLRDLLAR